MPDPNTHPFVCVKWIATIDNTFFTKILEQTNAELYLLYLSDGVTGGNQQTLSFANNTWDQLAKHYNNAVVPLCAATKNLSSNGDNWEECKPDNAADVFHDPGSNSRSLPYALWFLSLDRDLTVRIVEPSGDKKLDGHLVLADGKVVDGKVVDGESKYVLVGTIEKLIDTSVLAQAVLLKRLLELRPCATKAAIQSSGLIKRQDARTGRRRSSRNLLGDSVMPDNDIDNFMHLLRANGALVLEGVAGIGKTRSIDKVRELLSESFDQQALEDLLEKVIAANTGTPQGDNLTAALKKAREAEAALPEDQRANDCRGICGEDAKVTILVMHPSTSYEEMIGGLRPAPSAGEGATFTWQPGKLTRAILAACKDQASKNCRNHLIVLDEINRCNLPSVLGELIYLIEPSRRVDWNRSATAKRSPEEKAAFRDRYCIPLGPDGKHGDLFIPSNLFFLGTMNSSDRSILGFDQALRRRFPPYRLEPMTKDDLLKAVGNPADKSPLGQGIAAWSALNVLLRVAIGPDAMIGHSYWFNAHQHGGDEDACRRAWRFGVLPQAIHAAESARMERFLADLFKAAAAAAVGNTGAGSAEKDEAEQESSWNRFTTDYLKSRDTFVEDLKEAFAACHSTATDKSEDDVPALLAPIGDMASKVRLVGSGHGEKLVITDKQPTIAVLGH